MIHYVLILAGGKGSRLKGSKIPKQFLNLESLPILMHSIKAFKNADPNCDIHIGLPRGYQSKWKALCKKYSLNIKHKIYIGGKRRIDTVAKGLKHIYKNILTKEKGFLNKKNREHLVSIHDSARPFINSKLILELLNTAKKNGSAVPVVKLKNSLRKIKNSGRNSRGVDRDNYITTQTPQVFWFKDIYESYLKVLDLETTNKNCQIFDDAGVYDYLNNKSSAYMIDGRNYNIKITTDLDYRISPMIYKAFKKQN